MMKLNCICTIDVPLSYRPNIHLCVVFLCVMTLPEVPFKIKYSSYALSNIIPRGSHNPEKLQYVLEAQTKTLKEDPFCLHREEKKKKKISTTMWSRKCS